MKHVIGLALETILRGVVMSMVFLYGFVIVRGLDYNPFAIVAAALFGLILGTYLWKAMNDRIAMRTLANNLGVYARAKFFEDVTEIGIYEDLLLHWLRKHVKSESLRQLLQETEDKAA